MAELVNYSLYGDDGEVYTARIPQREVAVYEMYPHKRYRLLNSLKSAQAQNNEARWDDSGSPSHPSSDANECPSPSGLQASGVPTMARAQGKTGATWNRGNSVYRFLQVYMPYRRWLRPKIVAEPMWQLLSDKLYMDFNLDYSWEQLKEKIRSLKRQFKEAKNGKIGGTNWEHFWAMTYLFDDKMNDGDATLAPSGFTLPGVTTQLSSQQNLHNDIESNLNANGFEPIDDQGADAIPDFSQLFDTNNWPHDDDFGAPPLSSTVQMNSPSMENVAINPVSVAQNLSDLCMLDQEQDEGLIIHDLDANRNLLMSPGKKKTKHNDGTLKETPKTPCKTPRKAAAHNGGTDGASSPARSIVQRRTPRRKLCTQTELIWPPDKVKLLLTKCLLKKDKVQKEEIPVSAWKDIAKYMKDEGEQVNWELCRGKFVSVSNYFSEKLLYTGGFVSGVKVPYFDLLCQIYDIPLDFVMPSEPAMKSSSGNKKWDDAAMSLLISLYKARLPLFTGTKSHVRHDVLFSEISAAMVPFSVYVTGKQCKDKYGEMKKIYHKEYDACHKTGAGPSNWGHYREMDEYLGDTPSMKAPFIVSLGTSSKYQERGSDCPSSAGGATSRTRKTSNAEPKQVNKKPGRATYRSRTVEAQETRVEQQNQIIDEMKQMRELFDNSVQTQNELLKMLITKACNK